MSDGLKTKEVKTEEVKSNKWIPNDENYKRYLYGQLELVKAMLLRDIFSMGQTFIDLLGSLERVCHANLNTDITEGIELEDGEKEFKVVLLEKMKHFNFANLFFKQGIMSSKKWYMVRVGSIFDAFIEFMIVKLR